MNQIEHLSKSIGLLTANIKEKMTKMECEKCHKLFPDEEIDKNRGVCNFCLGEQVNNEENGEKRDN